MVSLFFAGCVDPGHFKEGKKERRKEKKILGNDFFVLFIYFVNSGRGAACWR